MREGKAMEPIETASDLYRAIKDRGLHLRSKNGRDDALLGELAAALGCHDRRLQRFLDRSDLSAAEFLRSFLELAAPFARMFQEIWDYLNLQLAPKATETISVRFGFEDADDRCMIDLEQFRRYVETAQRVVAAVTTQIWPYDALHGLFAVGRKLADTSGEQTWKLYSQHGQYQPGKPYDLPFVHPSGHPFDDVLQSIHGVFEHIINGYATEQSQQERARRLQELREVEEDSNEQQSLRRASFLLTDLLPKWFFILARSNNFHTHAKDEALSEYRKAVEPHLSSGTGITEVSLLEALDVLDLPFWRHRWHTYEVWATVLTLRFLEDYKPILRVEAGYASLDGYSDAVIADLKARDHDIASVAVQVETPFKMGTRKAIKPDLRICIENHTISANTVGVVEFKQRSRLDSKTLNEMARAYTEGCPNSGGCVILNYDKTDKFIDLPPRSYLIESVRPLKQANLEMFREKLSDILIEAGFLPLRDETTVLLDVSSSMGRAYQTWEVQRYLRQLLALPWLKILRFNNGLVEGGDLDAETAAGLTTSGGTQLRQALTEIDSLCGLPRKLLIVTDGEHDNPTDILARVPEVRECLPDEIGNNIAWLR